MNEEIKYKITSNWQSILIIVLIAVIVGLWQLNVSTTADLDTLKGQSKLQESLADTQKKLDDMKKREAELYPILQQRYAEYEDILKKIKIEKDKLNEITKQRIKKELEKANIEDIGREFNSYGYSNSIISK